MNLPARLDENYFVHLVTHEDPAVRIAAEACLAAFGTPRWKSRTMRKLLNELSWALHRYIKTNKS